MDRLHLDVIGIQRAFSFRRLSMKAEKRPFRRGFALGAATCQSTS